MIAAPLQPSPQTIPSELKAISRWLVWKLESRDGKPTKVPYQINGWPAKVNDPTTWTTFDNAVSAYETGKWSGLGIALSDDDDLSGVDIDKCLNPDTGELDPEASKIVSELPTYCEISPSGRGLRLFTFGKLPQGGRRKGNVEMYESGRYLTVTGHRFNGHDSITKCTAELAKLHARIFGKPPSSVDPKRSEAGPLNLDDATLLAKARAAKNGAKFDRLWSGDTSDYDGDDSAADLALCNLLAFWTDGNADRIDRLFRQSGLMRDKWNSKRGESTYGQETIAKAIRDCRETYSGKKQTAEPQQAELGDDPYRGTDEANAALFLSLHGADVRYCPPWEKWLLWTGSHWRIDDLMDVTRLAGDLPRELYQKAGKETDSDRRRTIAKLARVLESRRRQNDLLAAARCRVVVSHTRLDKDRFLLNAKNGTIDLSTGERREHRRSDLLTHDTEIPYKPDANASIWERFLSEIFAGDTDLIRFVQRAVGYSLTGDVREQVLLICHGNGSNGKSVFLNIVRKLLGKLALQAAPDLLMADRHRRHPTEQADLFGKRLVSVQETAEGRRFNEVLVKQLTGGDAVRARRMCEDFWEFEPTWKLWLSTNHRPEVRGTDHAIWRRIRLIPFNVQFSDSGPHRKDPGMEAKLTAELPGILAWAVRGCLDWQQEGLRPPTAVTVATEGYRADMDTLAAFLNECCTINPTAKVRATALYAEYTNWCGRTGERAASQILFGQRLTERNFERFTSNGVWYRGIDLFPPVSMG